MSNLLKTGAAWLNQQMSANAASNVTYTRGDSSINVAARQGRKISSQRDSEGVFVRVDGQDWIVTTADLVILGARVLPERNDLITEDDGTVYAVLPLTDATPLWEWHDSAKTSIRIHTKVQERATP